MTYTTTRWGPDSTPTIIKYLMILIGSVSVVAALTAPLFLEIFKIPSIDHWFSLSWYGLNNYQIWRLFTYFLIEPSGSTGITLFFLIALAFDLYIIWVIGSDLIEQVGQSPFLTLFITSGVVAGIAGLLAMKLIGYQTILIGPAPVLLALFTVWTMFHPDREIWILLLFQLKTKWLLAFILGAIFLINLSQLDWVNLIFYFTAVGVAYCYATMAWSVNGPYSWMVALDSFMMRVGRKLQRGRTNGKIFDFQTGQPLKSDEQFMDEMLEKIARRGPHALTRSERARMDAISEKKRRQR